MIQATNPIVAISFPEGVNLTAAREIYATIQQTSRPLAATQTVKTITKDTSNGVEAISATLLHVELTQADTLQFEARPAEIQVNWLDADGQRHAIIPETIMIYKNLIPSVLPVEEVVAQ